MSLLEFQFQRGGIFLPRLNLWLDPHEARSGSERVFVSHAHSDHIGNHREVILTHATAELMRARIAGKREEHRLPFNERHVFTHDGQEFTLTLLPAGHILGSAMSYLEAGGESLLYTGDFKLHASAAAEPCEPRQADTLIMETTFGRPEYVFPPTAEIFQGIIRFCREALANGETPVLLGYSLGKSQELLRSLTHAGLPLMLHEQVHKMTRLYEQLGQSFPPYEKYDAASARGQVLIFPPNAPPTDSQLGRLRRAVATGWAIDPSCRFQSRCDAAFPLSDHADYPELIEFVRRVNPRQVYTLHGFAADFARTLRELGFPAQALSEPEQLSFVLSLTDSPTMAVKVPGVSAQPESSPVHPEKNDGLDNDSFGRFAEVCDCLGATTDKAEKVKWLAAYLRELDDQLLAIMPNWFAQRPFAPPPHKSVAVGWALVRDAVSATTGATPAQVRQTYLKHNNVSETVAELLAAQRPPSIPLTCAEVMALFDGLAQATGKQAKLALLIDALKRCTANEARYLVKLITGELRIGLTGALIEEAISLAFAAPLAEVQPAHRWFDDLGLTAIRARTGNLTDLSLKPFQPVRATFVTDGFPGIRCQLHKAGTRVALYAPDLQDLTALFPHLAAAAALLPTDVILNGCIWAAGEEPLPSLAELQKRAPSLEADLFSDFAIITHFTVLDLLWENDRNWLTEPAAERHSALQTLEPWPALFKWNGFPLSAHGAQGVSKLFDSQGG